MALSKFNRLYRLGSRIFGRLGIKASEEQIADFLNWCSKDMWKEYTESRTQKRTVIENENRALNIRLPNGTVGREYKFEFRLLLEKSRCSALRGLRISDSNGGLTDSAPAQSKESLSRPATSM